MSTAPSLLEDGTSPSVAHGEVDDHAREKEKVALIRAHLTAVWGFLRRLGLSQEDAEDAAQEVFLTAVNKFDAIVEGQEKRFLFGIAVRIASRRRRSTKSFTSRAVAIDLDTCEATGPSSDEIVERKQALALLDEALASLDEELRTIFILYELEEMTMHEIATVTDNPPGTVASRLRRAREQFQKATRRLQMRQQP
jgi:RNA polymerase sigma-70 factor (ECF subfamily)